METWCICRLDHNKNSIELLNKYNENKINYSSEFLNKAGAILSNQWTVAEEGTNFVADGLGGGNKG